MVLVKLAAAVIAAACTAHAAPSGEKRMKSDSYAGIVNYGANIVGASADIVIPKCTVGYPKAQYSDYTSDGWVGISAYAKNYAKAGLLQTGCTCSVERLFAPNGTETGTTTVYQVWTEWAPAPPIFFNSTDFRPGDVIHASVISHEKHSGSTCIRNHRTGKEYTYEFKDQTTFLDYTNAEWITESQTSIDVLGTQGELDATYSAWKFHNAKYVTKDGNVHFAGPEYPIDTYLNHTKIAEGVFLSPGELEVRDTTPKNFTLPGID